MRVLGCKRPLPRRNRPIRGGNGAAPARGFGDLAKEGFAGGEGRGGRKEVVL